MPKSLVKIYQADKKFSPLPSLLFSFFQPEENFLSNGIFETIRTYHGRIFMLEAHLDRFFASAKALNLPLNFASAELKKLLEEEVAKTNFKEVRIRIALTNYQKPLLVIHLSPLKTIPGGIEIATVPLRRKDITSVSPRIKTLACLNNILAVRENLKVEEVVMLNKDGFVTEGSHSNIFIVQGKKLLTPHFNVGILKGITRQVVCQLAQAAGIELKETFLTRYDLYTADECFITCTTQGIVPVVKVDQREIGKKNLNSLTKQLKIGFQRLTQKLK
jgi:branched-chain amino acid aminotransferase